MGISAIVGRVCYLSTMGWCPVYAPYTAVNFTLSSFISKQKDIMEKYQMTMIWYGHGFHLLLIAPANQQFASKLEEPR